MDGDRSRAANEIVEFRGGHIRVLGPPGSGKTSLLVERFRRLTAPSAKKHRVAVITYTRRHHALLLDRLLEENAAHFGKTPVYTYHELALEIISRAAPAGWRLIDKMEQRVILSRVLRRACKSKSLTSDYASIAHSDSFQRSILQVLQNLHQHEIPGGDLDKLIRKADGERTRDIFVLARDYFSLLESHRLLTHFDAAWRAARIVGNQPDANPLRDVSVLLIDDFQDVDAGQYELIEVIAPPAGPAEVNVFGDPSGARARDRGATDRYLCEVFPRVYRPRDFTLPVVCHNFSALGSTVGALLDATVPQELRGELEVGGGTHASAGVALEVSLVVAEDEVAEAQHVAKRAAGLVASGKYRPEEIAVAARDRKKYESVLSRAFAERGLVLELGRRERHPLEAFVRSFLRLMENAVNDTSPASQAANLAAVADSPLLAELKGFFSTAQNGRTNPDTKTGGASWLNDLASAVSGDNNGRAGAAGLPAFFHSFVRPALGTLDPSVVPEGLLGFVSAMWDEWKRYCDLANRLKIEPALSEFLSASPALGDRAPDQPAFSSRVGFFSCQELAAYRLPVVFVVGCSELLFPAPPLREAYIPYASLLDCLERALPLGGRVEFSRARPVEAHLRDEYALMLNTLTRASRALHISGPRKHGGQYCPAPAFILAGVPRNDPGAVLARSPAPRPRLVKTVTQAGRVADGADRAPAANDRMSALWTRPRVSTSPLKLKERSLSASSLQTYTVCERRFFYDKVLRVETEETIHLVFGRLFHSLAQRICEEHRTYDALREVADSDTLEAFIDGVMEDAGALRAEGLVARAARHHLREMVGGLRVLEASRGDDYRIEATEQRMEFGHRNRSFVAVLDRRDRSRGGATVTLDYKTGSSTVPKTGKTLRERILPACKYAEKRLWQVPLYCRAVASTEDGYPGAFFYYVLEPESEPFAAGVYIGEEDAPLGPAVVFKDAPRSRFSHLTPGELEQCLDEAVSVADAMFAQRPGFSRTEDERHCRNCPYKTVCGRDN